MDRYAIKTKLAPISKQLISVLLLILFISHGVYQIFLFEFFKANYKEQFYNLMEQGIAEDELVLIKFSKSDINKGKPGLSWLEENEFRFNGEMYDIVKKEIKGDSVYLTCFHDENESVLYGAMDKILKQLSEKDPEKAKRICEFGSMLSWHYLNPLTDIIFSLVNSENFARDEALHLLYGEYYLVTPPPKV